MFVLSDSIHFLHLLAIWALKLLEKSEETTGGFASWSYRRRGRALEPGCWILSRPHQPKGDEDAPRSGTCSRMGPGDARGDTRIPVGRIIVMVSHVFIY